MSRRLITIAAALLVSTSAASAMCGKSMDMGKNTAASPAQNQCGGMGGMDMSKGDASKPAEGSDPHAGMDMGDAKKTGTGCCSCCRGMGGSMDGGKSGGMCGKQASINPDGSNDPLLNDPMWDKPSAKPAPKNQTPMP